MTHEARGVARERVGWNWVEGERFQVLAGIFDVFSPDQQTFLPPGHRASWAARPAPEEGGC